MKKDYTNRRDNGPAIRGAKVTVRNGDVNGALRTLKKILDRDNRQRELAKREYHEKPSIKRKRDKELAVKRTRRENTDFATLQKQSNPPGVSWNKSKRKRRRVLDAKTQFSRIMNRRDND
ncbi:MAG: 30S ribosomal protein S21 [Gammaproteobacteria bacterium]|nr:30S ribosomal protein S21 [Gammaproteobacteria bacterium]